MSDIGKRKDEHITINLEKDVRSGIVTGFKKYSFNHQALPELNLKDVNTGTKFLGRALNLPLVISSMTGGTEKGDHINHVLAEAAQLTGIAMGVGSQRAQLEKGSVTSLNTLRKIAPGIPLYANLGAVQLNYGYSVYECQKAVELLEADGLILHLNPLQEALQPEGQTDFADLAGKIGKICKGLEVPVIVKEVGWGITLETAKKLVELGVSVIDVAGAGGTSWSEVEKFRTNNARYFRIAEKFKDWGNPTAELLAQIRVGLPEIPLIASGGITGGMEIAKSIALGANIAGMARLFLTAANESLESVVALIDEIRFELMVTMFAAGAADIAALSKTPIIQRSA